MTHSSMCHLWIFVPIRFPSPFTESCVSSVARVMEDTPIPSSFFVFSSSLGTHVSALLQCSIPLPPSASLTFASSILPCSVGSISTPPHHPFSISFSVERSILWANNVGLVSCSFFFVLFRFPLWGCKNWLRSFCSDTSELSGRKTLSSSSSPTSSLLSFCSTDG